MQIASALDALVALENGCHTLRAVQAVRILRLLGRKGNKVTPVIFLILAITRMGAM